MSIPASEFRVRAEHRWPVFIAIAAAVVISVLLPGSFAKPVQYSIAAFTAACAVPLLVLNPTRLNRESRWSRGVSIVMGLGLLLANQVAMIQLIAQLVTPHGEPGTRILLAAAQVWVVNVIGYSLVYWEIDRGGPVARRRDQRDQLPAADFRFSQDEDGDTVSEVARASSEKADWVPQFFDYLAFSASTAMAFSPTDVMPLSTRGKALMLLESLSGFVLLALVIARSVNILS